MKIGRLSSHAPVKRGFVALLGNDKRQSFTIPLFAILLSVLAASIMLLSLGKNPLSAFSSFLQGSGILPKSAYAAKRSQLTDFMSMLGSLTPMVLAALAVAVALKTGLFNIGVCGQMLVPGFIASITVGQSNLPMAVAIPLVIVIGIVGGSAVGALIGWLKQRFNVNEVVSAIMLNYALSYIISFFINMYFIDPVDRQSLDISAASRLSIANAHLFGLKMDIPLGFLLIFPCVFLVKFLMDKTRLGYEFKVVGQNPRAARYAGIKVGRSMVLGMSISGALAGLAGVTYYLGYFNSIQPGVLTSVGFDSIAVSLLGNSNPVGIVFASLLITVISKGSNYMSSSVGVPQEIAQVITGLILLFSACGTYIQHRVSLARDDLRYFRQTQDEVPEKGGEEA